MFTWLQWGQVRTYEKVSVFVHRMWSDLFSRVVREHGDRPPPMAGEGIAAGMGVSYPAVGLYRGDGICQRPSPSKGEYVDALTAFAEVAGQGAPPPE